jgi:uncharacterized membrane protein YwzB
MEVHAMEVHMSRYNFFGITLEVYIVTAVFLAIFIGIAYWAYRDAVKYHKQMRDAKGERLQ